MDADALRGKVILVTGAARSIGAAMCTYFEAAGSTVIRSDIDDAADDVAHLDVRDQAGWNTLVESVVAEHGRIDGLVNNAAVLFRAAPFWDETADEFAAMLDVNVMGTWLGLQVVSRVMAERGGGSIVNFSSTSGMMAASRFTGYGTTRWAVRGLTKHVALGLADRGIRVNSIHPHGIAGSGMVDMFAPQAEAERAKLAEEFAARNPLKRQGTFDDVSAMATFLLSDDSAWITGREFVVDGGASLDAA